MMSLRGDLKAFGHNERLSMVMNDDNHTFETCNRYRCSSSCQAFFTVDIEVVPIPGASAMFFVKYFILNLQKNKIFGYLKTVFPCLIFKNVQLSLRNISILLWITLYIQVFLVESFIIARIRIPGDYEKALVLFLYETNCLGKMYK